MVDEGEKHTTQVSIAERARNFFFSEINVENIDTIPAKLRASEYEILHVFLFTKQALSVHGVRKIYLTIKKKIDEDAMKQKKHGPTPEFHVPSSNKVRGNLFALYTLGLLDQRQTKPLIFHLSDTFYQAWLNRKAALERSLLKEFLVNIPHHLGVFYHITNPPFFPDKKESNLYWLFEFFTKPKDKNIFDD